MKKLVLAALAVTMVAPTMVPTEASAQHRKSYHGKQRHYYRCKRSKGTTGTIAGAVGGGVLGNVLGGGTVGTLVGAGGGALLGRHLDRKHDEAQNRRNGC